MQQVGRKVRTMWEKGTTGEAAEWGWKKGEEREHGGHFASFSNATVTCMGGQPGRIWGKQGDGNMLRNEK